MKGFQLHYYWRLRDIEVAAFLINAVLLNGLRRQSAPRIDMSWGYKGASGNRAPRVPIRRSAENVDTLLRRRFWMPQVLLPHAVAVVIGVGVFVAALLRAPGFSGLRL